MTETTTAVKFVKAERDCPHNTSIRAKGENRGILYDYSILVDGKPRGLFRSHGDKRSYSMCGLDHEIIRHEEGTRLWTVEAKSIADFRPLYERFGHLLPDDAELERRRAERAANQHQAELERKASARVDRMQEHAHKMYDLIYSQLDQLGEPARRIITAIDSEDAEND